MSQETPPAESPGSRLKRLVGEARDVPKIQRQAYLEERCGGDKVLLAAALKLLVEMEETSDLRRHAAPGNVMVSEELADGGADSWERFVERIRARGPTWTRYRTEGELARGGMGLIKRVRDQDLRRTLAMKVMLPPGADGEAPAPSVSSSLGRFLEEAQVTSQLDHPGVAPVHEVGVDDEGRVFFTMKLVKGDDLRTVFDLVKAGEQGWNRTRALHVLLKVCEAMTYAHAKGVIHRDLKPANIMVGRYGETYVMDWGLAKILGQGDRRDIRLQPPSGLSSRVRSSRLDAEANSPDSPLVTMDGDVVGTPAYMSPEQAEGRLAAVGPQSDVYAMGAMLYHLLTGNMPYLKPGVRMTHHTMLAMVLQGAPPPIHELVRDVPAELEAICEKAMARDVGQRYRTMGELGDDLRAFLEHRVVAAYETGPFAELRKWVRRNQAITWTAAAALLVIALLTTWFVRSVQSKEVKAREAAELARQNELAALANERRAVEEKERADRTAEELSRLSDLKLLADLKARMTELWPAREALAGAMASWLEKARPLADRRAAHEATLAELRRQGRPLPHARDAELAALAERVAQLAARLAQQTGDAAAVERELGILKARQAELGATIERERDYEFDDLRLDWWHGALRPLVSDLAALLVDDVHGDTIAAMERRLETARTIGELSIDAHQARWDDVIIAIGDEQASPRYAGLHLVEQVGLVPIGRDPESDLFEFWHVESGTEPARDAAGRLVVDEQSGMVFVLLPGGAFLLGAQSADPQRSNYDELAESVEADRGQNARRVELAPFFLAKHETTQAQWFRLLGGNPSGLRAGTTRAERRIGWSHPVESISWNDAMELARRQGLALPSEAQWEYACRGGTSSPFHTGDDVTSLFGGANLADEGSALRLPVPVNSRTVAGMVDGWVDHAPVGTFRPNPFGLFDMHGNVFEWTAEDDGSYDLPVRPGDGRREQLAGARRTVRGGSCYSDQAVSRVSSRTFVMAQNTAAFIGVRFARAIDP